MKSSYNQNLQSKKAYDEQFEASIGVDHFIIVLMY